MMEVKDGGRHNSHNSHACNLCRQKKRRCNWSEEVQVCSTCRKAGRPCEISFEVKPRAKGTKQRHMRELEARVRQMETLLMASGVAVTTTEESTTQVTPSEPSPDDIAPPEDGIVVDNCCDFDISNQHDHFYSDGATCQDLPPPQEAALLLQEYLEDWNKAVPLFDPSVLGQTFQDCYAGRESEESTAWTVVVVVLGLAHKLKGMSPLATSMDQACAEQHKARLLKMVPSLLMQDPSLQVVQCLVGIGLLLFLDVDNNRAHLYITMALRMMEPFGMGACKESLLTDQWRTVFWIAFTIDTDLSLRWARMPSRSYEDAVSIGLPKPCDRGRIYAADGTWHIDYLLLRSKLALIQARVCSELLGNTSSDDSAAELLHDLQLWRTCCTWTQQTPRKLAHQLHRSDIVTLAVLEASHHMTVFTITTHVTLLHRRSASMFEADTLFKLCQEKTQPCLAESRRFIEFARLLPRGDVAWVYGVSHALMTSVVVLLSNACAFRNKVEVEQPASSTIDDNEDAHQIAADVEIAKAVLDLITRISGKCRIADCIKTKMICHQLYERTGCSKK